MELKPGARLRSTTSTAEVVVVKAPPGEVDLRCGGLPMVTIDVDRSVPAPIADGFGGAVAVGKRYSASDDAGLAGDLEVMVTKPGDGVLSIGEVLLARKDAKPLPASD